MGNIIKTFEDFGKDEVFFELETGTRNPGKEKNPFGEEYDVPVEKEKDLCPECGGEGVDYNQETCSVCLGDGVVV